MPPRKLKAAATPVNIRGVAQRRLVAIFLVEPKAPLSKVANTSTGLYPNNATMINPIKVPMKIAARAVRKLMGF